MTIGAIGISIDTQLKPGGMSMFLILLTAMPICGLVLTAFLSGRSDGDMAASRIAARGNGAATD